MLSPAPPVSPSSYTVSVVLREDAPQSNTDWESLDNSYTGMAFIKKYFDKFGVLYSKTSNTFEFEIPFEAHVSVSFILRSVWSIIPAFINFNGELLFWGPVLEASLMFQEKRLVQGCRFKQGMPIDSPIIIHASSNGIYCLRKYSVLTCF